MILLFIDDRWMKKVEEMRRRMNNRREEEASGMVTKCVQLNLFLFFFEKQKKGKSATHPLTDFL